VYAIVVNQVISGPLIEAAETVSRVGEAVFLDVRVTPGAAAAFRSGHVPGAKLVDLGADLSEFGDPVDGGRHPLPSLEAWLARVGAWGISPTTPVIVYDDAGGGMAAARAWWMLQAIGHEDLSVVDGGWDALLAAGVPIESGPASESPAPPYPQRIDRWPTAEAELVDRVRTDPAWRVIDARAPERYRGVTEPLDPVAGHIPGAQNLYWKSQLDAQSSFEPFDVLRRRYDEVLADVPPERVVCYCGSGVTACHLLLAMHACGLPGAKLYVGSWSEWCRQRREGISP